MRQPQFFSFAFCGLQRLLLLLLCCALGGFLKGKFQGQNFLKGGVCDFQPAGSVFLQLIWLWFDSVKVHPVKFNQVSVKWVCVCCFGLGYWARPPLSLIRSAPITKLWPCYCSKCFISLGPHVALELCCMYHWHSHEPYSHVRSLSNPISFLSLLLSLSPFPSLLSPSCSLLRLSAGCKGALLHSPGTLFSHFLWLVCMFYIFSCISYQNNVDHIILIILVYYSICFACYIFIKILFLYTICTFIIVQIAYYAFDDCTR